MNSKPQEKIVYTIGCSTHSEQSFIDLLKKYHINVLIDVRSIPYSLHTPQFNKEALMSALSKNCIRYMSFAEEFGARRKEPEAYTANHVDFQKVMNLPVFLKGVERVKNGIEKGYKIALMCTEKNPEDCHRFSLVSRGLKKKANIDAVHILFNGQIQTTEQIEEKILSQNNILNDLFLGDNSIEKVYQIIENHIAFTVNEKAVDYGK